MVKFRYWMAGTIWNAFRMVTNMLQPYSDILDDKKYETVKTKYDKSLKMCEFIIQGHYNDFMIDEKIVKDLKNDLDEIIEKYKCEKRDTCMKRTVTNAQYMIECILENKEWQLCHFKN